MTRTTLTDAAIETMLRERGGAMVRSELQSAILAAVRAEPARGGRPRGRWLAPLGVRRALAFAALAALLLAAALAAVIVGGRNGIPRPNALPSPAPSDSPATNAGGGGLILF